MRSTGTACCSRSGGDHCVPVLSVPVLRGGLRDPDFLEKLRRRALSPLPWVRPGCWLGEAVQGIPACLTPPCPLPGSLEQLVSPVAFPASSNLDPCAKETVLNAIKESRKRAVEREEEEEDQAFGSNQESKRR